MMNKISIDMSNLSNILFAEALPGKNAQKNQSPAEQIDHPPQRYSKWPDTMTFITLRG